MFIHNPFTIYLNTQFPVNEKTKSSLGIKSYYSSINEPVMLTDNDLMMFLHGRVFNLQNLYEEVFTDVDKVADVTNMWSVLLTIYKNYGIEYLLQVMQGEFVMVIIDQRVELDEAKIYAISESMGIIPLYLYYNPVYNKERQYIITTQPNDDDGRSSEEDANSERYVDRKSGEFGRTRNGVGVGAARDVGAETSEQHTYPGTCAQFSLQRIVHASWTFDPCTNIHTHYSLPRITNYMKHINYDLPNVLNDQFYLSIWDRFQYDTTTTHVYCLYHALDGHSEKKNTEYNILYNHLNKLCRKKNIFFSNVFPPSSSSSSTTRVFMVFGGCITQDVSSPTLLSTSENDNKTNLQKEYEIRNHLKTSVQITLLPLYESFYQEHGIMLEFPWMNSEWLQLYLSIPYSNRFDM
jgi:Glutamine amidotransferase domain